MILTNESLNGKCLNDFEQYLFSDIDEQKVGKLQAKFQRSIRLKWISSLKEDFKAVLYMEFFDSVGIYIETGGIQHLGDLYFWYNIQEWNTINGNNGFQFNTRHEATTEAIKAANELYNQKHK